MVEKCFIYMTLNITVAIMFNEILISLNKNFFNQPFFENDAMCKYIIK